MSAASNYRWEACMLCSHCQEHLGVMLTLRFSGRRRSHGSIHSSRRRCSHGSGYSCIHGSGHSCIHGSWHSGVHGSGHSCATGARTRVGLHGGLQAMPHRVSKSRGRETLHRLTSDSTWDTSLKKREPYVCLHVCRALASCPGGAESHRLHCRDLGALTARGRRPVDDLGLIGAVLIGVPGLAVAFDNGCARSVSPTGEGTCMRTKPVCMGCGTSLLGCPTASWKIPVAPESVRALELCGTLASGSELLACPRRPMATWHTIARTASLDAPDVVCSHRLPNSRYWTWRAYAVPGVQVSTGVPSAVCRLKSRSAVCSGAPWSS